jgi:hypothetical protein
VFLINPKGDLVHADGSVLPYSAAMKPRTAWITGRPVTIYPQLQDPRNAFGHVRQVTRQPRT